MELNCSGFSKDEQIALLHSLDKDEKEFNCNLCQGEGRDIIARRVKNVYDLPRGDWALESLTDRYMAKCDKSIFFDKTRNCYCRGDYFTPNEAEEITDDIIQFYYDRYPFYYDRESKEEFLIIVKYINDTWRWKDMSLVKERDRSIYYSKDDNCFVRKLKTKDNIEKIKNDFVKLYLNMEPFYYDRDLKMLFQGENITDLKFIKAKQKVLNILKK